MIHFVPLARELHQCKRKITAAFGVSTLSGQLLGRLDFQFSEQGVNVLIVVRSASAALVLAFSSATTRVLRLVCGSTRSHVLDHHE